MSITAVITIVDGQQQQEDMATTFQSTPDGFHVQVPYGWVVEDNNSTDPLQQQFTRQYGVEYLAVMCPQNEAFLTMSGLYSCTFESPGAEGVEFTRFVDLNTRPELAVLAREKQIYYYV